MRTSIKRIDFLNMDNRKAFDPRATYFKAPLIKVRLRWLSGPNLLSLGLQELISHMILNEKTACVA